jgi:hypothetical protein
LVNSLIGGETSKDDHLKILIIHDNGNDAIKDYDHNFARIFEKCKNIKPIIDIQTCNNNHLKNITSNLKEKIVFKLKKLQKEIMFFL